MPRKSSKPIEPKLMSAIKLRGIAAALEREAAELRRMADLIDGVAAHAIKRAPKAKAKAAAKPAKKAVRTVGRKAARKAVRKTKAKLKRGAKAQFGSNKPAKLGKARPGAKAARGFSRA